MNLSQTLETPEIEMPPRIAEDALQTERTQIVSTPAWIERVNDWRRTQPSIPTKSEAIRMLVDMALEMETKAKRR